MLFAVQIQSSDSHASQLWSELILRSISLQGNESWSSVAGISWIMRHLYTEMLPLSRAFDGGRVCLRYLATSISDYHWVSNCLPFKRISWWIHGFNRWWQIWFLWTFTETNFIMRIENRCCRTCWNMDVVKRWLSQKNQHPEQIEKVIVWVAIYQCYLTFHQSNILCNRWLSFAGNPNPIIQGFRFTRSEPQLVK